MSVFGERIDDSKSEEWRLLRKLIIDKALPKAKKGDDTWRYFVQLVGITAEQGELNMADLTNGKTLLHYCVENTQIIAADMLFEHNASSVIWLKDKSGETPISKAEKKAHGKGVGSYPAQMHRLLIAYHSPCRDPNHNIPPMCGKTYGKKNRRGASGGHFTFRSHFSPAAIKVRLARFVSNILPTPNEVQYGFDKNSQSKKAQLALEELWRIKHESSHQGWKVDNLKDQEEHHQEVRDNHAAIDAITFGENGEKPPEKMKRKSAFVNAPGVNGWE